MIMANKLPAKVEIHQCEIPEVLLIGSDKYLHRQFSISTSVELNLSEYSADPDRG